MEDVPWLALFGIGICFIVCWIGGIVTTWRGTCEHGLWTKLLWRTATVLFPLSGFIVFAIRDLLRPHNAGPLRDARHRDWTWLIAHIGVILLAIPVHMFVRSKAIVHVGVVRHQPDYSKEWWSRNGSRTPALCVAMSGGGIRSAAFNIGVLRALHEHRLLSRTEVMSAVSGGSYAMSWYLLQQYYQLHAKTRKVPLLGKKMPDALFDWDGAFQRHLANSARAFQATGTFEYYMTFGLTLAFDLSVFNAARLTSFAGNENLRNVSAARDNYRTSLQNTFHVVREQEKGTFLPTVYNGFETEGDGTLTRWYRASMRAAEHIGSSIAEEVTFTELSAFAATNPLPFFVFVTKLDVDAEDQPELKKNYPARLWPSVYELNAWGLGSDSYGYASWKELPANDPRFVAVRTVNVAPAISGAALSPASGGLTVNESWLMSFANVDLGYRVPRFRSKDVGSVYLSDGGHIENLGLYPLVRRKCRNIIVIDAEHEKESPYAFESYCKVKRALMDEMQRTLTVTAIEKKPFNPATPVVTGQITGTDAPPATVYYVKLSIDPQRRNQDPFRNPALGPYFPQDPTSNQNFDELRFKAYRELGYVVARDSDDLKELAGRLKNP